MKRMLLESKPVFRKDALAFIREEKDGHLSILSKDRPEYHVQLLNRTAKQILDYCDGQNSVDRIHKELMECYPKVAKQRIREDVNKTLVVLHKYGFIDWKGDSPFEFRQSTFRLRQGKMVVSKATEANFKKIASMLKVLSENPDDEKPSIYGLFHLSPNLHSSLYHEILLRQRIFEYREDFYFLEEATKTLGMLSVHNYLPLRKNAEVGVIILEKGKASEVKIRLLLRAACDDNKGKINKLKCRFSSKLKKNEVLESALKNEVFLQEACLQDEISIGEDEIRYCRFLF